MKRMESVHVVGVHGFVEACMVVGNLPEWLDQVVDIALGPDTRELRTLAEFDALWAQVEPRTRAFSEAAMYLYACLMGPLPVSHEEARQAALPAWEAQKDIRVLLDTLHTVLWENTQWVAHPPTATAKELKRAYKAAAKIVHPDKAPQHIAEATRMFRVIQQAYEALSAL